MNELKSNNHHTATVGGMSDLFCLQKDEMRVTDDVAHFQREPPKYTCNNVQSQTITKNTKPNQTQPNHTNRIRSRRSHIQNV